MSFENSSIPDIHMTSSPSPSSSSSSSSRHFRRYFLPCMARQDSIVLMEEDPSSLMVVRSAQNQHRRSSQPVLPLFRTQQPPSRERRIQSLESGRLLELNEEDLDAIKRSWHKIPDKNLWCQRMFLKLFSVREHIKILMGYKGMSAKQILQSPHFESHCQRFVTFWHNLVKTLCAEPNNSMSRSTSASCGDLESGCGSQSDVASGIAENGEEEEMGPADRIVGKIRELGLLHSHMPGVTFDADCWLMFKNLLIESVCGQHFDIKDKTCLGWCKLIMFVISEMKDAFNEGVRMRCNTSYHE